MNHSWLDDPILLFGISLAAGLICAASFIALLRRTAPAWVFLVAAIALVVSVYLVSPIHRIASIHGFYHSAIVYQVLNGELPPRDPLMGDDILSYPWGPHVLVAGIVWFTGLPVSWAFALLNLVALAGALLCFYHAAGYLFQTPRECIAATALAFLGTTFLPEGLYTLLLQGHGLPLEIHGTIPILRRFSNMNAMPIGVALFAAYTLVLMRTLTVQNPRLLWSIAAFPVVFFCGVLYPFALVALATVGASAGIATLATNRRQGLRPLIATGAFSALGAACALPIMHLYVSGRTGSSSFSLTVQPDRLVQKVLQDALFLGPALAVLAAHPGTLRAWYRNNRLSARIIAFSCVSLLLLHLLVTGPDGSEAKWRAFAFVLLALPLAAPFWALVQKKPLIAALLMGLFFSPAMADLAPKWTRPDAVDEVACEKGRYLHSPDQKEDAAYSWIAENLPVNALLIDANLNACVFGRRALYVAMFAENAQKLLGWTYSPHQFMAEIHGHPPAEILRRRDQVNAIFSETDPQTLANVLASLNKPSLPLFIVCHSPSTSSLLKTLPKYVSPVYESQGTSVFEVTPHVTVSRPDR